MSYCTPCEPNHGFLNHGCNVYGGLLFDLRLLLKNPKTSESVFIPQHNLASYWKRPYLEPHSIGFARFLTHSLDKDDPSVTSVGHSVFGERSLNRRNRNLLTGCALDESTVKFWTSNVQGARRRILEYTLCQGYDSNNAESWQLTSEDDTMPSATVVTKMRSPLLQLRYGFEANGEHFLFGLCSGGLHIINLTSRMVRTVFGGSVTDFTTIPYLENEIAVLDGGHFLWHGDLNTGSALSRIKISNFVEHISSSDNPRKIYVADTDRVYVADIRESSSFGRVLFSIPNYDSTDDSAAKIRYGECFPKPVIKHLQSPKGVHRIILIATSKKFYLLDERMPCKPYLETAHSIFNAGDYICSAPPFKDNLNPTGRVYGFYVLQHTSLPDVQHFSLYDHGGGAQWSMLSPIKRLLEPSAAAVYYNQQPKYGVRISDRQKAALFGFGVTRAIHIQDGLAKDKYGHEQHLLFRQTDNGAIWLNKLKIVNDDYLEDETLQLNANELRKRLGDLIQLDKSAVKKQEREKRHEILPRKALYKNNNSGRAVACPDGLMRFDNLYSPLDITCRTDYPTPEVAETVDDSEKLISKLVSDCFCCEKYAYGFRGSLGSSAPTEWKSFGEEGDATSWCVYDMGNLSQTYVALCLLIILGDDLSRVDKEAVLIGVGCCQLPDGSFCSHRGSENDMRFVFSGVAVCYILNDFSTVNVPKILDYIKRSVNYDGGIGEGPGTESHAGSTYCAIASLHMLGSLWNNEVLSHKQIERLKKWCLMKQSEGFHGRTNKPDDSCYAYWVGATLQMLDAHSFFDHNAVRRFLMSVQDRFNGFSRESDTNPDILHTYFSIAGLSLIQEPYLCPLYSPLNITYRTYERLLKLRAGLK